MHAVNAGETGQGAASQIVFCGITGIDGGIEDSWGEIYYYDTYRDYLGNWAYGGMCEYQPDQTLILMDNVGRLWYVNEVAAGVDAEEEAAAVTAVRKLAVGVFGTK